MTAFGSSWVMAAREQLDVVQTVLMLVTAAEIIVMLQNFTTRMIEDIARLAEEEEEEREVSGGKDCRIS